MAVQERFQNFVHHADVVVSFELLFDVHEIFVERIETAGQQLADMEANQRRRFEKLTRVLDQIKGAGARCANGGSVGATEQRCHLAKDDARFGGPRNRDIVLQNLDRAFDEEIEVARGLALPDDNFADGQAAHLAALK